MREAVIVAGARTPVGKSRKGSLAQVRPDDLGALVVKETLKRAGNYEGNIDDLIIGCAMPEAEQGLNMARNIGGLAGLPDSVPAITINRYCSSGLQSIAYAAEKIMLGHSDTAIAGGAESMSLVPMMGHVVRPNAKLAENAPQYYMSMGHSAEHVAIKVGVSREDQDAFALRSQQKTAIAQENGRLAKEIVPVVIPQRKGDPVVVERDEHPRAETTLAALSKLSTPFRKDGKGSVTAGNASGVNDGACALLLASEEAAATYGLKARGRVLGMAAAGVEPRIMGIGPAPASKKVLEQVGLTLDEMDVIELNEAFASQGLAVMRELGLADDDARVNPNGGAISLGHPLGMSGARLITTALNELEIKNKRYALCTMCIGVGQGIAIIIERV